jgi:acyl carrier protein phosphodiesterase
MNFLAHLFLADINKDSLIGHLLGDFVKGRAIMTYEPHIRNAIVFHRKIDTFSDAHTVTRSSRKRISPMRRRFAGVIVDVCYDHFLACRWRRYSPEPLARFCKRVYSQLQADQRRYSEDIQIVLKRMIAYDWLGGYRNIENIAIVLDRIASRLTRGDRFLGGIEDIETNYRDLEQDFLSFFPQLIIYSREYMAGRDGQNYDRQAHRVSDIV